MIKLEMIFNVGSQTAIQFWDAILEKIDLDTEHVELFGDSVHISFVRQRIHQKKREIFRVKPHSMIFECIVLAHINIYCCKLKKRIPKRTGGSLGSSVLWVQKGFYKHGLSILTKNFGKMQSNPRSTKCITRPIATFP